MLKLYDYFRSSASYRVRIALNLKGIRYERITVDLLKDEEVAAGYLKINPQGLVPALQLEDGTILTQSIAILEWIEATYTEPPLLSRDAPMAASVRQIVNLIACDIHPLNNRRVLRYLQDELGVDDNQKTDWYQHWIHTNFPALEELVRAEPFALGAECSLADVVIVPQVFNALRFEVDMSAYTKILSIYNHCNKIQAFTDAHPKTSASARR
ncbi:MAG: maleylacetoacetate isomerase [Proteobacteria bacterium]|nr:MAG: maleylacetoacetate isomerase [Pseudomonadota bacterium]